MALKNLPKNLTESSPPPPVRYLSASNVLVAPRGGQVVEVNGKGGIPCSRHAESVAFFDPPALLGEVHLDAAIARTAARNP